MPRLNPVKRTFQRSCLWFRFAQWATMMKLSMLKKMAESFVLGATTNSPVLPLTLLAVPDHRGISNVAPADASLRSLPLTKTVSKSAEDSEARIQDYINNLRFCISPTTFFQVIAAEKLYSLAGDWAGLGPNTLLFEQVTPLYSSLRYIH